MATNSVSPAVPQKAKDILLGEGLIYKDYGLGGQALIGPTRGGSKLIIDQVIRDMAYDGSLGPTEGMKRFDKCVVQLMVKFLKITYVNMIHGLNATVTDGADLDGTYKKITFNTGFSASDVVENITFKGFKADGTYCIIKITKAMDINDIEIELKEKDEAISERTYTGFYTYLLPTTPPLVIQEEITA